MIISIIDPINNSKPLNGRDNNEKLTPNKLSINGNKPVTHPGQAPPIIPKKIPTGATPIFCLTSFESFILFLSKFIINPKRIEMIIFVKINVIKKTVSNKNNVL
jgi:hypothetical protein